MVCCLQVLQAEVNYSDPEGAGFGMAVAERKLRHPKKYRSVYTKSFAFGICGVTSCRRLSASLLRHAVEMAAKRCPSCEHLCALLWEAGVAAAGYKDMCEIGYSVQSLSCSNHTRRACTLQSARVAAARGAVVARRL